MAHQYDASTSPRRTTVTRHTSALGRWEWATALPTEAIRPFAREYVGWDEQTSAPLCRRELPTEEAPLIINCGAPFHLFTPGGVRRGRDLASFITGAYDTYQLVESSGASSGVQVNFTLLGLRLLVGRPIEDMTNRALAPQEVFGGFARELTDRLYDARSWDARFACGAEIIGTAFYHAIGYNVVDVYLAELDRESLVIADKATIRDPLNGRRRRLKKYDLDNVFNRAARLENGHYRVLVSRFAPGKPLGNFRYYSRRPDDPNDLVAHEHRRELRGARVFGAWLNHDDSRGINSLDTLETTNGRAWVKHYMFDFGSILGSGTVYAQRHRPGNEYIFEQRPGWLTLATLGLYVRPWMTIHYPRVPRSVGRLEAEGFDPLKWKPEYPNPAFENMRPDDAFWAARIVSKFSDEAIRAVVEKAAYSDPAATDFMTKTIIARRDKVVATWINQVCPVVDTALSADGTLTFTNAAVDAKAATAPERYRAHLVPVRQHDRSAHAGWRADDGVERIGPRVRGGNVG